MKMCNFFNEKICSNMECTTQFYEDKISFRRSVTVRSNVMAFFCEQFVKVEYTMCDWN